METLRSELEAFKAEFSKQAPEDVQELMEAKNKELKDSEILEGAFNVGSLIPDVSLSNASGKMRNLRALALQAPLVITFYRGGWCPYCNLELRALQKNLCAIQEADGNLIAITPELPDASLTTQQKNELTFEVLSDVGNKVAKEFGLLFTLPEELRPVYEKFGIDIPGSNGDSSYALPLAATYVVDRSGTIAYAFLDTDYRERAEPAELIEVLQSLKNH